MEINLSTESDKLIRNETEAIECLKSNKPTSGYVMLQESIDMAIQALEKQIEMKKYCDENDCADCPYHNTTLKDNRCMNDFIIEKEG